MSVANYLTNKMTPINKAKEKTFVGKKVEQSHSIRACLAYFPLRGATFEVIENLCPSIHEREPWRYLG